MWLCAKTKDASVTCDSGWHWEAARPVVWERNTNGFRAFCKTKKTKRALADPPTGLRILRTRSKLKRRSAMEPSNWEEYRLLVCIKWSLNFTDNVHQPCSPEWTPVNNISGFAPDARVSCFISHEDRNLINVVAHLEKGRWEVSFPAGSNPPPSFPTFPLGLFILSPSLLSQPHPLLFPSPMLFLFMLFFKHCTLSFHQVIIFFSTCLVSHLPRYVCLDRGYPWCPPVLAGSRKIAKIVTHLENPRWTGFLLKVEPLDVFFPQSQWRSLDGTWWHVILTTHSLLRWLPALWSL